MRRKRFSLRVKLMTLLLAVALAPAGLLAALSLQALDQVVHATGQSGVAALEREATSRLDGSAQQSASQLDVSFEQGRAEATALARFTGFLFSHPDRYSAGVDTLPGGQVPIAAQVAPVNPNPPPDTALPPGSEPTVGTEGMRAYGLGGRLQHLPVGIWANEQRDLVGVYLPGQATNLGQVQREMAITSHLDSWLSATHGVNPVRLSAYVVLQDGLTRIYPNWGLSALGQGDYEPTRTSYYRLAEPVVNPDGSTQWTSPYEDRTGLGRVVTAAAPIYTDGGTFLGVACVDVLLADVAKSLQAVNTGPAGYALLVDRAGRVVTAPDSALHDLSLPTGPLAPGGDIDLNLRQSDNPDVRQLLTDLTAGDRSGIRELTLGGEPRYLAFSPLRKTGWTLVLVEPKAEVLKPAAQVVAEIEQARNSLVSKLEVILLLVLALVVLVSLATGTAVTRPLANLTNAVRDLATGRLKQPIPDQADDEIGELAREFNRMAAQLTHLNQGLEQKVGERTSELARKADQLRALNRASQKIASLLDPGELLHTLVGLVADTFGYAETSVFLMDKDSGELVLRVGINRATDRRLPLPAGLGLPLSSGGALATAARTGRPVLLSDAAGDPDETHLRDQLRDALPKTRALHATAGSLLAVPIRLAEQTLGVLYVTGARPGSFNQDDIFTLSTLADQMAVALANAQLFAEERERRLEARDLAIAEERNRMAREIHDTLAQGFLGIILQLQAAEAELPPDAAGVAARVSRAADLARESLQEARRSVWNLRPQRLERATLPEALRQEAAGLGALGEASLAFHATGEERPLPPAVEAALLRVAQEALSNVRKHAQASRVTLTLAYETGGVRLVIADDGLGFDQGQVAAAAAARRDRSGFGLFSMRERVEGLGGQLELTSKPGQGTTVEVFVPVR